MMKLLAGVEEVSNEAASEDTKNGQIINNNNSTKEKQGSVQPILEAKAAKPAAKKVSQLTPLRLAT